MASGAPVALEDVGTARMAWAAAEAVNAAIVNAGLADPADATLAIVEAPLPPPGMLALDEATFAALKGRARGAAAMGAAIAIGEQGADDVNDAAIAGAAGPIAAASWSPPRPTTCDRRLSFWVRRVAGAAGWPPARW